MSTLSITVAMLVTSLASTLTYVPVRWVMTDSPEERRIEICFLNDASRTLCISEGDWPTPIGKLHYMSERVALVVGDERFPVEDFNTGYCDGECVIRVLPGKSITGFIPYADFNLPERLRLASKKLEYPLNAFVCK